MSKFGWDLPPGVSARDLPGNTPQEAEAEAFYDLAYDQLPAGMSEEDREKLVNWMWEKVNEAYSAGYSEGMSDGSTAMDFEHSIHD